MTTGLNLNSHRQEWRGNLSCRVDWKTSASLPKFCSNCSHQAWVDADLEGSTDCLQLFPAGCCHLDIKKKKIKKKEKSHQSIREG